MIGLRCLATPALLPAIALATYAVLSLDVLPALGLDIAGPPKGPPCRPQCDI